MPRDSQLQAHLENQGIIGNWIIQSGRRHAAKRREKERKQKEKERRMSPAQRKRLRERKKREREAMERDREDMREWREKEKTRKPGMIESGLRGFAKATPEEQALYMMWAGLAASAIAGTTIEIKNQAKDLLTRFKK